MPTLTSRFSSAISAFTRACRRLRRAPVSRVRQEQEMMRMVEYDRLMAHRVAGSGR